MPPLDRLGWAAAALLGLLLLVQTIRLAWLRGVPRRRLQRARGRGLKGERRAMAVLERNGYRIDAVQPAIAWNILCDDEPYSVELRADLLVSRDGQSFIAEVKTGECAQLDSAATRRQLLEYSIAYAVDGVLLVDMHDERVQQIRFPHAMPEKRSSGRLLLAATILLALAGLWVRLSP
jgi:hypothetical protein